jgi:hypothetical protein
MVLFLKNRKLKNGYQVVLCFSIGLHEKDRIILEQVKEFFNGIGNITNQKKDAVLYRVNSPAPGACGARVKKI